MLIPSNGWCVSGFRLARIVRGPARRFAACVTLTHGPSEANPLSPPRLRLGLVVGCE